MKNEEERSFILDYSRVRILQAVNSTTIFFYCIKNQANSFCAALLDIITGKVTPHEYLDIKDYDRVSFISCGTPQLAYIRNCGDYDSTGLYLYNCLTKQSSRLTPEELQYRSWSGVFKFVTKDLIALRCGDYKEVKPVRLFDIRTQQFVQAFSHPTVGTGFYAKSPMILGACEAGQNKFATVAVVDKNFQLILWDMQNGTIKYQVEIPAKSTEHPIAMTYDTQRDLLYVACGDVVNAMQLTPNLTDTYAASLANNKSLKL